MFFFGILAGWSNENSVCWVILVLLVFIYVNRQRNGFDPWMVAGIAGLFIGYALLMFAPGNMARFSVQAKDSCWLTWENVKVHAALLFLLLAYFHIFLWYFNWRSFCRLRGMGKDNMSLAKELMLSKTMCIISFNMTFMMMFSPVFQTRSAFPGTVMLIITAVILLRIQDEYSIVLIRESARKFLRIVGSIYFVVSVAATVYGYHSYREQIDELIYVVQSSDYAKNNTIEVESFRPVHDVIDKLSHFHLIYHKLSSSENAWINVAFSRYYGIKGIRMIEKNKETN